MGVCLNINSLLMNGAKGLCYAKFTKMLMVLKCRADFMNPWDNKLGDSDI